MNINPVLSREIRQRFRRRRSPMFFSLWLAIVASFAYLIFLAGRSYAQGFGTFGIGSFASSAALGRMMFELTAIFILTAVIFVVPGVMSLSIVTERELLTLKLLQMSQLRPWQIIAGKIASGLSYVLLLILAVGPVLVLPVVIGGVQLSEALAVMGITILTAVTLGSISTWVSARAKSSRGAVAGSYLWAFVLTAGTMILLVAEVILIQPNGLPGGGDDGREFYSVWPNPYVAMVSSVTEPVGTGGGELFSTPFTTGAQFLAERQGSQPGRFVDRREVFGGFQVIDSGFIEGDQFVPALPNQPRGPVWIRTVIIYLLTIVVTIWFAARAVAAPDPPPLFRRRAEAAADA